MKKLLTLAAFTALLSCGGNSDESADSVEMSKEVNRSIDSTNTGADAQTAADKNFLVEAASGGLMEVQLGKYVQANAASPAVKNFAKMMAEDHTKADSMLTTIATVKGIAVPNIPGEKHQHHINELTKKKGKELDKDYMKLMVDDHEEDIKKFEEAANNAQDTDIRKFAAETLPVLKKHLEEAKKINEKN